MIFRKENYVIDLDQGFEKSAADLVEKCNLMRSLISVARTFLTIILLNNTLSQAVASRMRFRPDSLALYNAESACRIKSSAMF